MMYLQSWLKTNCNRYRKKYEEKIVLQNKISLSLTNLIVKPNFTGNEHNILIYFFTTIKVLKKNGEKQTL